jgi:hypothetical protein
LASLARSCEAQASAKPDAALAAQEMRTWPTWYSVALFFCVLCNAAHPCQPCQEHRESASAAQTHGHLLLDLLDLLCRAHDAECAVVRDW